MKKSGLFREVLDVNLLKRAGEHNRQSADYGDRVANAGQGIASGRDELIFGRDEECGVTDILENVTPGDLVAGSVTLPSGFDAAEVAWNKASELHDTEKVHFIHTVTEGRVWLLSIPSSTLANSGAAGTPLAMALPGFPGHKGDGVYVAAMDWGVAAVLLNNGKLTTATGPQDLVADHIRQAELPVYDVENASLAPWMPYGLEKQRRREALVVAAMAAGLRSIPVAMMILAAAGLVRAGAAAYSAWSAKAQSAAMQKTTEMVREAYDVPLSRVFNGFDRMAASVMAAGGHMVSYRYTGGKITWTAVLPGWTPDDVIARLSANGGVVQRNASGQIVISRGAIKK